MLTCKELAQLHASDYLDNRLTGWQRFNVRLHLAMCSHCRRFMRQMKLVRKVLSHKPEKPLEENRVQELAGQLAGIRKENQHSDKHQDNST